MKNEHINQPTLSFSLGDKLREAGLVTEGECKTAAWWRRERRRKQIAALVAIKFGHDREIAKALVDLERHEAARIVRKSFR